MPCATLTWQLLVHVAVIAVTVFVTTDINFTAANAMHAQQNNAMLGHIGALYAHHHAQLSTLQALSVMLATTTSKLSCSF